MIKFSFKKIVPSRDRLGKFLKGKREKKNISLEDVAQKIGVQERYLHALEEGEYKELPGEVYGRSFLCTYLEFLGEPKKRGLEVYCEEYHSWSSEQPESEENLEQKFKPRAHPTSFFLPPKFFKIFVSVLIGLICVSYLVYKINEVIKPPFLDVTFPPQNYETQGLHILVEGQTVKEVKVTINNEIIYSDQEGYFSQSMDLQKGLNTIKISVVKKHGRERVEERHVLVK